MGYLVKPFSESELRAAVEIALYKHEAETKLREIGQRLTDTLKGMGDGVLTTDLRGRITVMNPAAESLVGCRYEDVVGKDLGEVFKIIHRDTGAPIESPVTRALREGTIVDRGENTLLVTRSGEEIPIDDTAAPVRDDEGNITGVVLVLRDGTERLRSEAWTKQLEAQSLQAEKLESLVTVVGGVAHDLNNTLSDMLGFTQLALEEAEPASTISQNLRQVETLGQQAAEMIRQLLVFSRKWGKNESAAASILGRDLQVAQTNYPGEYRD
jgi:PAS domain S-box-containing protein